MGWIWTGAAALSLLWPFFSGNPVDLGAAAMEGAKKAVELILSLAGPICLWSGVTKVMEAIGWTDALAQFLSPLLQRLFPGAWSSREAREALCGNVTANLLGLGNAATPMGLRAAKAMAEGCQGRASNELCRLVVVNTASIQLLPTTVASVRATLGASSPFDILPAVWVTSLCAVTVGLLAAKVLSRWM